MPLTELIQMLIHKIEIGAGSRYLRYAALAVTVVALAFFYDVRVSRNFSTQEAMDSAQLARNIADGKGYTTLFIRPFSLYLVQKHNIARLGASAPADIDANNTNSISQSQPDFAHLKTAHPDLANPPVYPVLLAGLMEIVPFKYPVELEKPFWSNNNQFWRYRPDFIIGVFNEIFLLAAAWLTFLLARNLFDSNVAWLSAILVLGCELLWRFCMAGMSTILLIVIFLVLTRFLFEIEKHAREPEPRANRMLGLAVAAGILTGIGALTRYAFGWTIIPVAVFLILFTGQRRLWHMAAALIAFAIVLAPWIVRNELVSGTVFGTAGYALVEGTFVFPQFQLERSIHPNLSQALWFTPYVQKLLGNLREILSSELPRLGGSWAGMLFLTGLLLGFRGAGARRVRYFLLMCLGVFIFVQALGKTQLSEESPEINSENLLVVLAPVAFIYGASFFLTLVSQMASQSQRLHFAVASLFAALCCLPMVFALLPPKNSPVVFPPYYPPEIQTVSGWMKENELMMSDVPWAVAWYGRRQCVWLTLNPTDEFEAIHKNMKPVSALYLTPKTMDAKFISDWALARDKSWGNFIFTAVTQNQVPPDFPLRHAPAGFLPERMFLADDQKRWEKAK
jgi:hypothetical protein